MSVVTVSQAKLVRLRQTMNQLLRKQDWQAILELESELMALVDEAIKDSHRDPAELLKELGQVLGLYRSLSEQCHYFQVKNKSPGA